MKKTMSIVVIALSSVVSAQKISSVYDGEYNFSSPKTYDWSKQTKIMMKKFINVPVASKEIIKYFREYGYEVQEGGKPDLIVDIDIKRSMDMNPPRIQRNASPRPYARPAAGSISVTGPSLEKEGNYTLKLIDPKSKDAVWMASGTSVIDEDASIEKKQKRVKKIIKKMFKKFPGEKK